MGMSEEKTAEFSQKLCDILNYGALNAAMGIGYASGAFEALGKFDAPASCESIALQGGLDERYLQEWLGVMVSGGIVEVSEPETDGEELYFLPKEYVPLLTRSGGNSNMGVYTQEIPLLTQSSLNQVVSGMQTGEGIGYENYSYFYSFMEELANAKHEQMLVETFLPSVMDGVIVERLRKGIHVCDMGCADGVVLQLMAKAFPESTFVGFDISEASIEKAQQQAANLGLKNVQFVLQDVGAEVVEAEQFDYIMAFDVIHDLTRPFEALKNIQMMLKPEGVFSMVDITASSSVMQNKKHPMGMFLYTVSLMHCMPVGLVDNGMGLGMMWGREQALDLCYAAGFSSVEEYAIPEDAFNSHYLCHK
ncbi:methyltransferase domain-containing protein [Halodesulfovibrio sp.]|jgi:2-polyprenyl-3-methyl-5-hydroxy-6-metoxy-1,4-benzoquinol methylase|uniref:methyltransferase domain-containing protein n=1 Tax=Halodesulfovibrio sp. TaxID=1912772 RepID=UPI0025F4420C|nr:methyltransferase domain-containing protein [Halodesulfovibrio sp.]MCT4535924.1 methyltransferase domain-containing protein [Halodesulfovibrio sp.]